MVNRRQWCRSLGLLAGVAAVALWCRARERDAQEADWDRSVRSSAVSAIEEPQPSRPRDAKRRRMTSALVATPIGLLILLGGALYGLQGFDVKDMPLRGPDGVAFVGPALDSPVRGVVVSLSAQVAGCRNPVEVTVAAAGSAEYWRHNEERMGREGTFAFAIDDPGAKVREVALAPPDTVLNEHTTFNAHLYPHPQRGLIETRVERNRLATVASGRIRNWRRSWEAVYVRFAANWLYERSRGSCFLLLPALTGSAATGALFAGQGSDSAGGPNARNILGLAESRPFRHRGTFQATSAVQALGGEVDGQLSRPSPEESTLSAAWRCSEVSPFVNRLSRRQVVTGELVPGMVFRPGGGGLAYTEEAYRRRVFRSEGCGATVVIEESGADARRDVRILLVGAVIALGMTLAVQGILSAFGIRLQPA
jgi:hypothetical protein